MSLVYTMIVIFVLGYLMIAMEHKVNVSKSSVALVLCCLLWAILSVFSSKIDPSLTHDVVSSDLLAALGSTCEIIVFLIGAMTIVDIIDTHGGFEVITRHITTRKKTRPPDVADSVPDILYVLGAGQYDHDHHHGHAHPAYAQQL